MNNQIYCQSYRLETEKSGTFAEYISSLLNAPLSMPQITLIVCKPRRPLEHLLLIMQNNKNDEAAAAWAIRLAQASSAFLAILPVIPLPPNFLPLSDDLQTILAHLLKSNAPLGLLLRRILQQMDALQIRYELQLQRGTPDWQVAQALDTEDPDLLITGSEKSGWLNSWWMGEFVSPLLRRLDRPILIAGPQKEGSMNAYERFGRN